MTMKDIRLRLKAELAILRRWGLRNYLGFLPSRVALARMPRATHRKGS